MTNPHEHSVFYAPAICELPQARATVSELAHTSRTHGVPIETRFAFTPKRLDALKCKTGRFEVRDTLTPGLELRVTADKKSWSFSWTIPGTKNKARIALGTYPATPYKAARERSIEARGQVEAGIDPRTIVPASTPKTMRQLIELRLEMEVRGKLDTADEIEQRFNRDIIPLVGDVAVKDFRMSHLNEVLNPKRKAGKARTVGVLYQDLRALFNFAVNQEYDDIDHSPIAKAKIPLGSKARTRWLTAEEIKTIWRLMPGAMAKSDDVPTILKLCLITGQRLSEVAGMRRSEIDMHAREWLIPAARTKNGHEHLVPLSELAARLIGEALRDVNEEILFPNNSGDDALAHYAIDRTLARAQVAKPDMPLGKFGIARWMPHDLRRTMATHMSMEENGLNILPISISHVLNHRSATKACVTQQVYIQNTYKREKRDALDKWGAFLARLVGVEIEQREAA